MGQMLFHSCIPGFILPSLLMTANDPRRALSYAHLKHPVICKCCYYYFFVIFWRPPGTYCVLQVTQFQLTTPLCVSNLLLDLCCSGLCMSCPPIRQKCQRRKTKVTQLWLHFITRCLCIYFNTYSVAFLYHTFRNMTRMSKKDRGLEGIRRSQPRLEFTLLNTTPVWDNMFLFFLLFYVYVEHSTLLMQRLAFSFTSFSGFLYWLFYCKCVCNLKCSKMHPFQQCIRNTTFTPKCMRICRILKCR